MKPEGLHFSPDANDAGRENEILEISDTEQQFFNTSKFIDDAESLILEIDEASEELMIKQVNELSSIRIKFNNLERLFLGGEEISKNEILNLKRSLQNALDDFNDKKEMVSNLINKQVVIEDLFKNHFSDSSLAEDYLDLLQIEVTKSNDKHKKILKIYNDLEVAINHLVSEQEKRVEESKSRDHELVGKVFLKLPIDLQKGLKLIEGIEYSYTYEKFHTAWGEPPVIEKSIDKILSVPKAKIDEINSLISTSNLI